MAEQRSRHRPVPSPGGRDSAAAPLAQRVRGDVSEPAARREAAAARGAAPDVADQGSRVSGLHALGDRLNGSRRVAQLRALGAAIGGGRAPGPSPGRDGGLPGPLRAGVEAISGVALDRVKVHYDSPQPARLNALAFARGTDIHLAPGQERHLPHEAWHVVQQARGQVRPTMQLAGGVAANADAGLEREADVMGERAVQGQPQAEAAAETGRRLDGVVAPMASHPALGADAVVQAVGNPAYEAAAEEMDVVSDDDELYIETHQSGEFAARSLADQNEASGFEDDAGMETESESDSKTGPRRWGGVLWETEQDSDEKGQRKAVVPEQSRPVGAYIVNAILPYGEVARIPEVIHAMLEGLGARFAGNVGIVLGINAPTGKEGELDEAFRFARQLIAGIQIPIGLVRSTFKPPKFPFGTMRNEVLHSEETRTLTEYFAWKRFHPYISFQDFDTGSRRVGSEEGPHVFEAVDEILAGRPSNVLDSDMADPVRPLMIAGGYRPGSAAALIESTIKRLEKEPVEGVTAENLEEMLAEFADLIAEDMKARDRYAELDPLLPYAPEPNLFVDATAAAIPSPLTRTRLRFGAGGAEFTELGKRLAQYAAEELEAFHSARLPQQQADDPDLEEVRSNLAVDALSNRHPQRERSFQTDFQDLSVATDLSRLAHGFLKGQQPQSHTGLTQVVDRFFDTKDAKTGASFSGIRTDFVGKKDKAEFMNKLYVRQKGEQSAESIGYFKKNARKLGGTMSQPMSGALRRPFSATGLFKGLSYGADSKQAVYFAQQVAIRAEMKKLQAERLRQSVQDEALRIGVSEHYEIGHADGSDRNCTIISIFKAAGADIDRQEAQAYRRRLAGEFPVGLNEDIELTPAIAARILQFVAERTGRSNQLYILAEGPRDQNNRPTYDAASLAGHGAPIFIFFAGTHFSPAWQL